MKHTDTNTNQPIENEDLGTWRLSTAMILVTILVSYLLTFVGVYSIYWIGLSVVFLPAVYIWRRILLKSRKKKIEKYKEIINNMVLTINSK